MHLSTTRADGHGTIKEACAWKGPSTSFIGSPSESPSFAVLGALASASAADKMWKLYAARHRRHGTALQATESLPTPKTG